MSLQSLSLDDDYVPLRSLNDLLYCERRCALHRIENVWTDNVYTLEARTPTSERTST